MPSAALRDERVSPASSPDHAAAALATKRYDATPPPQMDLVEPGDTIATTKEEEWVTRKRSEVTTTRQIATRVQREVLLEDGRVVADSGPAVKTTTTQDVYTQEHHQTEQLALDQPSDSDSVDGTAVPGLAAPPGATAVGTVRLVSNPDGVVRESHQRRVVTHEQRDDVKETEEKYHLGDITDDAFVAAVSSTEPDGDIRKALKTITSEQLALVERGPKLVKETTATKKTIDTEDTDELRALRPDGTIVTETKRTTEHEEIDDKDLPENEGASVASGERRREGRERAACVESEARTDLMAGGRRVGAHVHSRTRTHHAEKEGDPVMEDLYEWDSLSMRMRRQRKMRNAGADAGKEAYVKKPIDFDLEEETRKKETSKWLEHHFGSDSRSSRDSLADEPPRQGTSTAYFNVTIKSRADADEGYCGRAQRPPPPVFATPPRVAPSADGYFKGVSEWSQRAASPAAPPRRRSPRGDDFMTPALTKRESPPGLAQRDDSAYVSSSTAHSPSRGSPHRGYEDDAPSGERARHYEREEPAPDYSPPRERRASPSPPPARRRDERKQHQRTRFAAESERRQEREPAAPRRSVGGAIGDSIRKLVGRLRSASRERRRSPATDLTSRTYAPSAAVDAHIAAERPPQRYYLGEDPFAGSIYGREHKYEGASPRRHHDDHRSNFTSTLGRFSHSTSRLNPDTAQDDYTRSAQTLPRKLHGQHKKTVATTSKSNPLTSNKRSTSAANVSVVHVTNGHHPQGPAKPARSYKTLNRSKSFAMGAPDDETHSRYPNVLNRNYSTMYKSNPQFSRLDETPEQLKSPGIVSIINRSQRDLADAVSREAEKRKDSLFGSRYGKNVSYTNGHNKYSDRSDETDTKRIFMKGLRERAPELFHTLHADDDSEASRGSPRYGSTSPNHYNRDRNYSEDRKVTYKSSDSISPRENSPYTPKYLFNDSPSRLRSPAPLASSPLRRGSNSSDNYSETYRYTTKSGDPERPTLTNTVETVSKKVIPSKDGRSKEIIQSRELNSVTTSRFRGEPVPLLKPAEKTNRYVSGFGDSRRGSSPLYSERRTNGHTVTERIRDYRH